MGSSPNLQEEIAKSADGARKMADLSDQLQSQLEDFHKRAFGFLPPSAIHPGAYLSQSNLMLIYTEKFEFGAIIDQAHDVLNAAFAEEQTVIVDSGLDLVRTVMSDSVQEGKLSVGIKHNSVQRKDTTTGDVLLIAALHNTSFCALKNWATSKDFYASYYLFEILRLKDFR